MTPFIRTTSAAIRLATDPAQADTALEELLQLHAATDIVNYLDYNCLAPLSFQHCTGQACAQRHPTLINELRERTIQALVISQQQGVAISHVHRTLSQAGIPYALFKGAAARLSLYSSPHLRPAADIDLLVSPSNRDRAIQALSASGLKPGGLAENHSHEVVFMHSQVEIDLHWHLLRPGRLSPHSTDDLLRDTVTLASGYSILAPEATLSVQLIHPTHAKYVSSPWAKDIRIVDLMRLIDKHPIDWEQLAQRIKSYRGATAAWCNLLWMAAVSDIPIPAAFVQAVAPSPLKQRYLARWILGGLVQRYCRHRNLMRFGFTLATHDNAIDSFRMALGFLNQNRHH